MAVNFVILNLAPCILLNYCDSPYCKFVVTGVTEVYWNLENILEYRKRFRYDSNKQNEVLYSEYNV